MATKTFGQFHIQAKDVDGDLHFVEYANCGDDYILVSSENVSYNIVNFTTLEKATRQLNKFQRGGFFSACIGGRVEIVGNLDTTPHLDDRVILARKL